MTKNQLYFILAFLLVPLASSGQNFNFSQYGNTASWNNPSQPSLQQEMAVRLNYRMQAVGGMQAIRSTVLNAYYPFFATRRNGPTSTVGLMVLDDAIAPANGLSFQSLGLSMSFAVSLSKYQRLSFGLMSAYGMHRMNNQGLRSISQYLDESGYTPSLPLNEPLIDARATFLSWNAGVSWLQKNRQGALVSSAGFSFNNLNKPREVFQTFENTIPLATQAFFFTTAFESRYFSILPETFFSSYGSSYQLQLGTSLKYNLRYTSMRQGHIRFLGRYNLLKSFIVGARLEQPSYEVGISTDIYAGSGSPFTQAFELSFALKRGVEGRYFKFRSKNKRKKEQNARRKREAVERSQSKRIRRTEVKLPVAIRMPYKAFLVKEDDRKVEQLRMEKVKLGSGRVLLGSAARNMNFKTGSTQLTLEAIEALKEVGQYLLSNSEYKILVVGHTDDIGGASFNDRLSLDRAEAVKEILKALGVEESRIITEGAGMNRPVLPNTSEENRRLNRRVEFILFEN